MLDLAVGLMSKEEQARLIHRITILIRDKAVLSDILSMMREAQIAGKTSKVARKVARKGVDVAFKDVKPAAGMRRLREKAGVN